MKVKVSKVMLNEMIKWFKGKKEFNGYGFWYCEMTPEQYEYCVDYRGVWENEIDYDYAKNKVKVLAISYPEDYYACDKYLTTKDLLKCFRNSDKTLNGFMQEIANEIEC